MDYLTWNDRIAATFFTPTNEGRRVYLFVTKELLASLGGDLATFISALRCGPNWAPGHDVCGNAEAAFHEWRRRKLDYPPYIGYLAFFALAAGIEGDFAHHAYYPRLRTLLGEPPVAGTYLGFSKMRALWDDLEVWSQQDRHGRLGVFQADLNSRFVHVGLPISQTILSETERHSLPAMFAAGGLDAQERPPDAVLLRLLVDNTDALRPRTRQIVLAKSAHEEEFESLIEAVAQELSTWDGSLPALGHDRPGSSVAGSARLWCEELDSISGTIQMRLICRIGHDYPDDGLSLEISQKAGIYTCNEFRDGWSDAIVGRSGEPFNAAMVDWRAGLRLRETSQNWRFYLPASSVRLFADAAREGLSGYLETQGLTPATPFLLLVRHEHQPLIEHWGNTSCRGFARVPVLSGLPDGWLAYLADAATNDDSVRSLFPVLTFPHTARISFRGGLSAAPSTYFAFALPEVLVAGVTTSTELFCNGKSLGSCTAASFALPDEMGADARLQLELRDGPHIVSRRSIYVEPDLRWPQTIAIAWCDGRGDMTVEGNPHRAAGAVVYADVVQGFSDWVPSDRTLAPPPIIDSDANTVDSDGTLPGTLTTAPVVSFTSEAELRRLIEPWRHRVCEHSFEPESVSSLPGGAALTEGAIQYLIGGRSPNTTRNWSRAIKELTEASHSTDPIISTLAIALLQLAFYRSGRFEHAAPLGHSALPHGFTRLQSFMKLVANPLDGEGALDDGIGITDISPLEDDSELEKRLFASVRMVPEGHTE